MKISTYFAFGAMAFGALAMPACGGGGEDSPDAPPIIIDDDIDAAPDDEGMIDAPPMPAICNPAVQSGCADGEKCDWVVPAEGSAYTACVANGTVPIGGACTYDEATGVSDCMSSQNSGGVCLSGVCEAICSQLTADSCGTEGTCLGVGFTSGQSLFEDAGEGFGTCNPNCDPVALDCAAQGEEGACYAADLFAGTGVCLGIPDPETALTQDEECVFVNDCRKGESCGVLQDSMARYCTFMCTPDGETLPDGSTTIGCDYVSSMPGMAPPEERTDGPGTGYECRYVSGFYTNTPDVPPHVGMCLDTAVFGSCADDPNLPGCNPTPPDPMMRTSSRSVPRAAPADVFKALRAGGYTD